MNILRAGRFSTWIGLVVLLLPLRGGAAGQMPSPQPPAEAWVSRYNGPGNGEDVATEVAVDSSGNVYITGVSTGDSSWYDYATIKYNPNGNQLWEARYNGPENANDVPHSLAVDGAGNVYVTGYSMNETGSYSDYATIKYDTDGNQLWLALYNGRANALAVDGVGNVYVTGVSTGAGTGSDYATIKYDPSGTELWVAKYNGTGNGYDLALALAVDSQGNVHVTGYSMGIDTQADAATIKYDPDGNQLWVARYNGLGNSVDWAQALAVDTWGNVYVAGYSRGDGTGADYATIKYDPSGNELWAARYNGPGNGDDEALALVVDRLGNVYVTGSSPSDGTGYDYATIKYDPFGNQLWIARYNGPGNSADHARALAVDNLGNVYVTGLSTGADTNYDYATTKYNTNGNQLWAARYNGPDNGEDEARALVLDSSGNVYVSGGSLGSSTGDDYATIKYVPPPPPQAETDMILGQDKEGGLVNLANDGATGVGTQIARVYDANSGTTLDLLLGSYTARLGYDGTGINVLGVRGVPPWDDPVPNIDNAAGTATFNGLCPTGCPTPTLPAFALLRLVGSVLAPYSLTLEWQSLQDGDGGPITPEGTVTQTFLRGDVKADGIISIADALFARQYLVGLRELDTVGGDLLKANPVNLASIKHDEDPVTGEQRDIITSADILFLRQYLVGLRDEFMNLK